MSGRITSALSLIVLVLGLAACGGDGNDTTTFDTDTTVTTTHETNTTATTTTEETTKLRVYFLRDGYLQPVAREVPKTPGVAAAALDELLAGPNAREQNELGVATRIPAGLDVESIIIEDGVARVTVSDRLEAEAQAQITYTLTQFPTVKSAKLVMPGATRAANRADFEDETPAILVETPLPFEGVGNPLRAKGTANTFEANFEYEVVEPEGRIVDSNFVTATSGSGTRGTFDFTSRAYEISRPGLGALIVYERSAKDGSRIHLVEIPVRMER